MRNQQVSGQGFEPATSTAAPHELWRGAVRQLTPAQLYHFQWHLLRTAHGGGRAHPRPTLEAFLREYGAPGTGSGAATTVVLGCFVDRHMRGAAVFGLQHSEGRRAAQIAFSVERPWQGRGIGTALMAAAIRAARDHGVDYLYLRCHTLNDRMQRIAERFAARIGFEDCECFADIPVRTGPSGARAVSEA